MADDDAVSLSEAARLTGLSTDALRLRWRRGTLGGYKSGRRLMLYRNSLPGADRSSERLPSERDRSEEIAFLKAQIEAKDQQISQLHVLLGRMQEQLALPPPSDRPTGLWRRLFRR